MEKEFTGDFDVLRVIFSTDNPLLTYHLLKTEIPLSTMEEYMEYLDAKEALEQWGRDKAKAAAEAAQNQGNR